MNYISTFLLLVVLLAQIILFALFFAEKRRDASRHTALLQYIDRRVDDADCQEDIRNMVNESLDAFGKKIDGRFKHQDDLNSERFNRYNEQVNNLLLDYSEAQQAANKVNDFASSLASIFDYDPIQAIQKGRNKEAS